MNIKSFALAVAMLAMPVAGSVSLIGGQAMAMTSGGGGGGPSGGGQESGGEYAISYPRAQTCLEYNTLNGQPQKGNVCKKAKSFINGGHFI